MLRRQSHPFARILRDLSLTRGLPLLAVISSILFLGIAITINEKLNLNNQSIDSQVEPLPRSSSSDPY
jgi:hypothetical protein